MGYDIYNQGGIGGQYDSSGLNYGQMHMHPNQQPPHVQQAGGGDGSPNSGVENSGNRQKNNKGNTTGNNQSNAGGVSGPPQGNLLHDHNSFGAAGGGGSGYNNQFLAGRQDQQFGNMYQQPNNFPPMMFPGGPLGGSGPAGGGLGGSGGGGTGYSQMGGGNGFSRGNNFPGNNSRGSSSNAQNPSANMGNVSGGNGTSNTNSGTW